MEYLVNLEDTERQARAWHDDGCGLDVYMHACDRDRFQVRISSIVEYQFHGIFEPSSAIDDVAFPGSIAPRTSRS
jgi:hypothetical protein